MDSPVHYSLHSAGLDIFFFPGNWHVYPHLDENPGTGQLGYIMQRIHRWTQAPRGLLDHGQSSSTRQGRRTVYGTTGRPEQLTPPLIRRRRRTFLGLWACREQRTPKQTPPRLKYVPRDYDPDDTDGLCRGTRTTRPRDLPGAGRRASPMHWTQSQALYARVLRGQARVPFKCSIVCIGC